MSEQELMLEHQLRVIEGVQAAVAHALDRHRRLGESIAVMQDDEIVILQGDEIPTAQAQHVQKQVLNA
jgi:hypothetical protein